MGKDHTISGPVPGNSTKECDSLVVRMPKCVSSLTRLPRSASCTSTSAANLLDQGRGCAHACMYPFLYWVRDSTHGVSSPLVCV